MRIVIALACALALASVTACGTSSSSGGGGGGGAQSFSAGDLRLDALAPQPFEVGRCGMFLWARGPQEPVFVFAAFTNPNEARMRPNGRDRTLERTAASGESQFGHFETQTFSDNRFTIETEVQFSRTRTLRDGAAIDGGVIRVQGREGWETVVPVTGMVACQG